MLQDYRERERLAREAVRKVKKNLPWLFTKEGSRRLYRAQMETESIERLVALAREGDKDAMEILKDYGRGARRSGMNVPRDLHELVWECWLDGPPKAKSGSGPKDIGKIHLTIALLVKTVSWDYGFPEYTPPERRDDPDAPMSACRLVAEELGPSERYVEEIWAERKESVTRRQFPPN